MASCLWDFTQLELWLLPLLTIVLLLLLYAKRPFTSRDFKRYAANCGTLTVVLSSCGLIHFLVPGSGDSVELGPGGRDLPLLGLFLCLMGGTLLVFVGASDKLGDVVPFRVAEQRRAGIGDGSGHLQRPIEHLCVLIVFSYAGLIHLLFPGAAEDTTGSLGGKSLELPVLLLFLSTTVGLVMVFWRIST